ncbi:MAG TPA: phenylalanine--tRNA ligase subunit beta, partial [Nitrospirota bacterium]
HSVLDVLFYYLGLKYRLDPAEHPLFLQGRCGRISAADGVDLGFIGEVRPDALERTQIAMPCAAFEVNLDRVLRCS